MAIKKPTPKPTLLSNQYNLVFSGNVKDLYRVWLPWALLTLVTGGVAWFWLNAKKKEYLYAQTSFLTIPLSYRGTGAGACLRVLPWFGVILAAVASSILVGITDAAFLSVCLATSIFTVLIAWPAARHQHHKYSITHTVWASHPLLYLLPTTTYVLRWNSGFLLTVASLGFYYPHWRNQVFAMKYDNIRCGEWAILFTGKGRDVFEDYVSALPATVVTGGVFYAWLVSKIDRYRFANIWIGGQEIGSSRGYYGYTGTDYITEWALRAALLPLSFGLLAPILIVSETKARLNKLAMIGNLSILAAVEVDHTPVEDDNSAMISS